MSFVLMEDLRKPLPNRRFAFIASIRIVRPLYKLARLTYRSSRYLIHNLQALTNKRRGSQQTGSNQDRPAEHGEHTMRQRDVS